MNARNCLQEQSVSVIVETNIVCNRTSRYSGDKDRMRSSSNYLYDRRASAGRLALRVARCHVDQHPFGTCSTSPAENWSSSCGRRVSDRLSAAHWCAPQGVYCRGTSRRAPARSTSSSESYSMRPLKMERSRMRLEGENLKLKLKKMLALFLLQSTSFYTLAGGAQAALFARTIARTIL